MAVFIAPNASVDPKAQLEDDVHIGPFCLVGPDVRIGQGTRLENHVTILGNTVVGRENHFWQGVVVGTDQQDLAYRGTDTRVIIGNRNTLRESVTVHRATEKESGITSIGDDVYLMAGCHVAHDCRIGNRVVIANGTLLGGHVHVYDDAALSGAVGIHHFTTIGSFAFVAGMSRVVHDVPPFMLCEGSPARPRCVNTAGLRRKRFVPEVIEALENAFRLLYRKQFGLDRTREELREQGRLIPQVNQLLDFLQTQQEGRNGRGRDIRRAA